MKLKMFNGCASIIILKKAAKLVKNMKPGA